jgi:peptidase M28-like protein/PDZ domain-containing protein
MSHPFKPVLPALIILLTATLQAPAWSIAHAPETARELRKQRAQKNLDANRRNLDRLAREAELPDVDSALVVEFTRMITYLADPAREGRAPGSIGIHDAASYIESELEQIGLTPAFDLTEKAADDTEIVSQFATFRQPMPMGSSQSATTQALLINGIELNADEDFSPLAYSGSTTASGQVVFAGYAIVSGPDAYMSFGPNENLKDKVALCLKYEPMDEQGNSLWKDEGWSHHSRLTYKVSALERRGASAVLIVSPDGANDASAGLLDTIDSTSPPASMARNGGGPKFDIPVLSITPEAAQMILDADGSGRPLEELIAQANSGGIIENLDDATVEIEVEIERTQTYTDNIGGILRGKGDLADEFIVIGAHYDHVGYGHFGSRGKKGVVHPGADDNASGTTGVILAAQQLADQYALLSDADNARSILFLLFTAEESGLNGSKFYVENPITDIENHEVMLNMDMIGRLETDPLEIGGFKSSEQLKELAMGHLDEYGIIYDMETSVGDGRSDHASFDTKKVPNMFFFTGLHDEYHTPEDTLDLVDMTGAVRVATVCAQIAYDAAITHDGFIHRRESNNADKNDNEDDQPKIRIGIIPSDAADGGLFVQRVFDNTSASIAGLQKHDRITHWDGTKITSVEAWSPVLLEHEPGDVVTLSVVRGDETMEIKMTLKGIE